MRYGNETNGMYFIYAGKVQESIPIACFQNQDETIVKYAPIDDISNANLCKLPIALADKKRSRTSLELLILEKYDIFGKFLFLLCFLD